MLTIFKKIFTLKELYTGKMRFGKIKNKSLR